MKLHPILCARNSFWPAPSVEWSTWQLVGFFEQVFVHFLCIEVKSDVICLLMEICSAFCWRECISYKSWSSPNDIKLVFYIYIFVSYNTANRVTCSCNSLCIPRCATAQKLRTAVRATLVWLPVLQPDPADALPSQGVMSGARSASRIAHFSWQLRRSDGLPPVNIRSEPNTINDTFINIISFLNQVYK
jgi:hypothetical protein